MAEVTTVHLLRHGEVDNPAGVLYGRLAGYKLSQRGLAMAAASARFLAGEVGLDGQPAVRRDITTIISSPLERAQQTAGECAQRLGVTIQTDGHLIEADSKFTGHVVDGAFLRRPRQWPKLVNPFIPSWGEPYRDIAARMMVAIKRARLQAAGHEALLVSHQLPIWVARLHMEGKHYWHDPRKRQCALASVTSLRFEDGVLVRIDYADPAARV